MMLRLIKLPLLAPANDKRSQGISSAEFDFNSVVPSPRVTQTPRRRKHSRVSAAPAPPTPVLPTGPGTPSATNIQESASPTSQMEMLDLDTPTSTSTFMFDENSSPPSSNNHSRHASYDEHFLALDLATQFKDRSISEYDPIGEEETSNTYRALHQTTAFRNPFAAMRRSASTPRLLTPSNVSPRDRSSSLQEGPRHDAPPIRPTQRKQILKRFDLPVVDEGDLPDPAIDDTSAEIGVVQRRVSCRTETLQAFRISLDEARKSSTTSAHSAGETNAMSTQQDPTAGTLCQKQSMDSDRRSSPTGSKTPAPSPTSSKHTCKAAETPSPTKSTHRRPSTADSKIRQAHVPQEKEMVQPSEHAFSYLETDPYSLDIIHGYLPPQSDCFASPDWQHSSEEEHSASLHTTRYGSLAHGRRRAPSTRKGRSSLAGSSIGDSSPSDPSAFWPSGQSIRRRIDDLKRSKSQDQVRTRRRLTEPASARAQLTPQALYDRCNSADTSYMTTREQARQPSTDETSISAACHPEDEATKESWDAVAGVAKDRALGHIHLMLAEYNSRVGAVCRQICDSARQDCPKGQSPLTVQPDLPALLWTTMTRDLTTEERQTQAESLMAHLIHAIAHAQLCEPLDPRLTAEEAASAETMIAAMRARYPLPTALLWEEQLREAMASARQSKPTQHSSHLENTPPQVDVDASSAPVGGTVNGHSTPVKTRSRNSTVFSGPESVIGTQGPVSSGTADGTDHEQCVRDARLMELARRAHRQLARLLHACGLVPSASAAGPHIDKGAKQLALALETLCEISKACRASRSAARSAHALALEVSLWGTSSSDAAQGSANPRARRVLLGIDGGAEQYARGAGDGVPVASLRASSPEISYGASAAQHMLVTVSDLGLAGLDVRGTVHIHVAGTRRRHVLGRAMPSPRIKATP